MPVPAGMKKAPMGLEGVSFMRLNLDCVRDVLLAVEEKPYGEYLTLDALARQIASFTITDVAYTCIKLKEGGLLQVETAYKPGCKIPLILKIWDLTFDGHKFLEKIRNDDTWAI